MQPHISAEDQPSSVLGTLLHARARSRRSRGSSSAGQRRGSGVGRSCHGPGAGGGGEAERGRLQRVHQLPQTHRAEAEGAAVGFLLVHAAVHEAGVVDAVADAEQVARLVAHHPPRRPHEPCELRGEHAGGRKRRRAGCEGCCCCLHLLLPKQRRVVRELASLDLARLELVLRVGGVGERRPDAVVLVAREGEDAGAVARSPEPVHEVPFRAREEVDERDTHHRPALSRVCSVAGLHA
mmetsp:Transcript_47494/g.111940  ORF Transcript_47494/g.111940 Transcript_47494/m.111940 type:complete len:238 (-) Transcript_47494:543-1256(-)